jgi:hypothetical protein
MNLNRPLEIFTINANCKEFHSFIAGVADLSMIG